MTNLDAIHSDWRRIADTTMAVYESEFRRVNSPMLATARETYEAARPHSALILAHSWMENQHNTTNIEIPKDAHNFLAMRPEKPDDPGPYGSGIVRTAKTGQFLRFASFADCVREWHRRTWKEAGTYKGYGPYKNTTTLESYLAVYAPAGDVHGVTGKDNADINYLSTVTTMLKRFAAAEVPPTSKEDTAVTTMKAVNFVGAKRTAYLPSWIAVSIRIINHDRFRSYSPFTHQVKSTYHDTANPRTEAEGEFNWAAGGRQGGSVGGYNFIFDDKILIQTGPLNERSWHAGTPVGNESFGAEHAFGGSVVYTTSLEIGMALHGALIEMQDLNPDDAAVLHQFWTGKYCSGQILNRGIWPQVKAGIKRYYTLARQARNGQQPSVPAPGAGAGQSPSAVYADPQLPAYPDGTPWDGRQDLVIGTTKFEAQRITAKTTVNLRRRQWGSTESLDTGPVIPAETEVELLGWVAGELVDGVSEWWVGTSGSRLWAGGIDAEPKADPDYGKLPEQIQGVYPVNGRAYYPLNDEETGVLGRTITIKRDGNLRKWADPASEGVGEVKAGEDRVFKYWTRGEPVPLYDGGPEESIWYAEDLYSGARMWAGLSDERPD